LDRLRQVEPVTEADRIDPGRKVVLFVGRMGVEKNIETLVAAFQRLLARRDDVDVVLCGQGNRLELVRSTLRQGPAAGRVHILGFTTDVWAWMKRADVLVNPSHFEGHPNAVLEAAALGTPLVLSDIPSHRVIFPDTAARFVPTMDVNAWVAQITATLDDPTAAQRASQAREIVSQYTPDVMADAYEQVYRDVLKTSAK
jgi:glycosyltransferase involved in cell wall biosynthesis